MNEKRLACAVAACALAAAAQARPEFVLPETIYAAPGVECNVYYANVFDSCTPGRWAFQTYAPRGASWSDRWSWTPSRGDGGREIRIVVNAWSDDSDTPIAATSTVKVANLSRASTNRVTLALFGDSLTGCGYQDQLMREVRRAGWKGYVPVGTRRLSDDGALHDGYGGWSYNSYLKEFMMAKDEYANVQDEAEREQLKALGISVAKLESWQTDLRRSPLLVLKDGKVTLDAKPWLGRVNGGKAPDFLFVMLGINATWWTKGTRAEVEAETWKTIYSRADNEVTPFVREIRRALPETTVLLAGTPMGCDQNGYAANYGSDWNWVQQRKNTFALNKCLERFVRESGDGKLVFVGTAQGVDPFHGYLRRTQKVNARCAATEEVCCNAVHPAPEGGLQIGDMAAAAVLWQLGRQGEKGAAGK